MQRIELETQIAAPPERCFFLSLSVDLHLKNMEHTGERAIDGVTSGILGLNETVTWQGRHFACSVKHEARITHYDCPQHFRDVMVTGMFKSFEHDHYFDPLPNGITRMRDDLRFAAPLGPLGSFVEAMILHRYLTRLLLERNHMIRRIAESSEEIWTPFLLKT